MPLALIQAACLLGLALLLPATSTARSFSAPTYSSPISLSADGRLVWVVNPGADQVAVISTRSNRVIRRIKVGDEPQGIALDPSNRYAYVANAAQSGVTLIRITNANPRRFRARRIGGFRTGAEPWNIVASPNGRRIFVANSGQDTITVIDGTRRRVRGRLRGPHVLGAVKLRGSRCSRSRNVHFQPRGLAVTRDSRKLYVTAFLSFVRPGGRQGADDGKRGLVCRLNINTRSSRIRSYRPAARVTLGARPTGFTVDSNGDGAPDGTSAFPNQLQSIVIRGGQAFLPNIAASPSGPQRFDVTTQAFVNVIDGVRGGRQRDASGSKFLNLHLGARDPEPGRKKLFFANPWAIGFTSQRGGGNAYVVSAAADLLVKLDVSGSGRLSFTGDSNTTRYIDLRDPTDPVTSGRGAGINPQGIVIARRGTRAYVTNFVSRNVSVVSLDTDRVIKSIPIANLPPPGSQDEIVNVGAQMFFSSRGLFDRPAGASVSTSERLSQAGWQSCASCHFKGLTDGVVWQFPSGPRKSVPLNASFDPKDRGDQRILNYSAIFDEIEDFELNIRNVSGPGPLAAALACASPPPAASLFDRNHGLLFGDDGDVNVAPCVINAFLKPNADRRQFTVTLPGSNVAVPAQTAMREWVRNAIRTPNGPLTRRGLAGSISARDVARGRALFTQVGCANCHLGGKFTLSSKDFTSPPAASEIATEGTPAPLFGNPPRMLQFLPRFLRNVGSFNIGVPGQGNDLGSDIGADEKTTAVVNAAGVSGPAFDALGRDYNGDGKGDGYNVPSLLGIEALPPYYHNGACETLACVVGDRKHRTANGTLPDRLTSSRSRGRVVTFLRSITGRTPAP